MTDFLHSRSPRQRRLSRSLGVFTGLSLALLTQSPRAQAEDAIPACTASICSANYMQLAVNGIQYAPGLFKLQARISQAKIPVGDAVFDSIIVNLIRPGATTNRVACTETIPGVRVRNSVLNLDIGRKIENCQLDQVIAQEQDLSFEICINSPDNCLKPIPLGSTPYALKANYAVLAQKAHEANQAVQAHYAHRVTADTELFVGERTHEDGYLDFATPDGNTVLKTTGWERISTALKADMKSVYGAEPATQSASPVGGFIQWTPVSRAENAGDNSQEAIGTLHLVAKDEQTADKLLKPLAKLMIHADKTFATGEMHVLPTTGYSLRSTGVGTAIEAGETKAAYSTVGFTAKRAAEMIELNAAGVYLRTATAEVGVGGDSAVMRTSTTSLAMSAGKVDLSAGVPQGALKPASASFETGSINLNSGAVSNMTLAQDTSLATRNFSVTGASSNMSMAQDTAINTRDFRVTGALSNMRLDTDIAFDTRNFNVVGSSSMLLRQDTAFTTRNFNVTGSGVSTLSGGTSSLNVTTARTELTGGGTKVTVDPKGVSLNNACLLDVNPACSGFSGANITSLEASKIEGALSESNLPPTLPALKVTGQLANSNLPTNASVTGNLSYAGQLSKLDTVESNQAYVRARDFLLGHSSRRGSIVGGPAANAPGRALVDLGSSLALNYARDWPEVEVNSSLLVKVPDNDLVIATAGACSGGTFRATENTGGLCVDTDEIQTTRTLNINNVGPNGTGSKTVLGPIELTGPVTGAVTLPASSIDIQELDLQHVSITISGGDQQNRGSIVVKNALHCSDTGGLPYDDKPCISQYSTTGWVLSLQGGSSAAGGVCSFVCTGDDMTMAYTNSTASTGRTPVDHNQ